MQSHPLTASGLEVMLMLQGPPANARIEYSVLAGTEHESKSLICGECFTKAVEMLIQYGSAKSKIDFVTRAMDGHMPVAVGEVYWQSEEQCMYCAVAKQGRLPKYTYRRY